MTIRRANRPVMHDGGMAKGAITELEEKTFTKSRKVGRDTIDEDITSFVMVAEVEGVTGEPVKITSFAGLAINDEPIETTGRGNKIVNRYNRFTTLCLRLGVIAEDELPNVDEKRLAKMTKDLAKLIGKKVSFKITKKDNGYYELVVDTIIVEG